MSRSLPAGYETERERGATVVALPHVLPDALHRIREHGTLSTAAAAQAAAAGTRPFTGRGAAYRVTRPHGDEVVRHYRRGGMVARMMGDRYLRPGSRPFMELAASVTARSRGVRTPEVLAAVEYPHGPMYTADLATSFIPDSRDLAEHVLGRDRGDAAEREAAWRAAGELLRTVFDAGVVHRDLNLRNILVVSAAAPSAAGDAGGEATAWLLDLDRAVVRDGGVDDVARRSMLRRLHRSREKLEQAWNTRASEHELDAFNAGLG